MKNSESLQEFKKLNSDQITEKIDQLRKDLFDLRFKQATRQLNDCLLYTSPSPRDLYRSRMPSSA